MKKVLTAIAFSLSALVATTAMAAPQHDPRFDGPQKPAPHWNAKDSKKWNDDRRWQDDRRHAPRTSNPSRDWRVGDRLPQQFNNKRFEINRAEARRLPDAGRNQQWYKINNDYVLINERNNKILKIIG